MSRSGHVYPGHKGQTYGPGTQMRTYRWTHWSNQGLFRVNPGGGPFEQLLGTIQNVGVQHSQVDWPPAGDTLFEQVDQAEQGFALRPHALHADELAIDYFQDRLEIERSSQKTLGAPDPAAAVQELQSVQHQQNPNVLQGFLGDRLALRQGSALGRSPSGSEDRQPAPIDPVPESIKATFSFGSMARACSAEANVPDNL